jgi:hypothetical protein
MSNFDARRSKLGVLWLIYALFCIVRLVWLVINSAALTLMWGALLNRVADPFLWMSRYHFAIFGIYILLGVTAVISFLSAVSLFMSSNPSRMLALIAGFLGIVTGPIGIAIGVYTWIVFVPRSADQGRLPASS